MGGRLILTQITSEGVIKSCKIGTWFLEKMLTVDILDEKYFNDFARENNLFEKSTDDIKDHNNYDNDEALFAPYHYGINVFDFQKKKVFYCNDYNGFLIFGTGNIEMEYEKIGHLKQETYILYDKNKNMKEKSIYDENKINITTPRMIESCIRNKGEIYVNKEKLIINEHDDFFLIAAKIYGQDLSLLSEQSAQEYIIRRRKSNAKETTKYNNDQWTNIEIRKQGWTIVNGDSSSKYINSVFNQYEDKLTEQEKLIWNKYINDK